MSFILPKPINDRLQSPFVIVCEGYGDAKFIDQLLTFHQIDSCTIGCPSDDVCKEHEGKTKLEKYLRGIRFETKKQNAKVLRGLLVIVDSDQDPNSQFESARSALKEADFPFPDKQFDIKQHTDSFRSAIFLMPGENRTGTLEHLLLEAIFDKIPSFSGCIDEFFKCTGLTLNCSENQQAKMKMSALIAACCKKNPWASPSMIWHDPGNPVPIESTVFNPLFDFLHRFIS